MTLILAVDHENSPIGSGGDRHIQVEISRILRTPVLPVFAYRRCNISRVTKEFHLYPCLSHSPTDTQLELRIFTHFLTLHVSHFEIHFNNNNNNSKNNIYDHDNNKNASWEKID